MNIVILKGRITNSPALLFGKTAELIAERFVKGQEILLEGNLKVDVFEKEEKKQYKTSVMIERVEFCGSKKNESKEIEAGEATETDPNSDEFPF